MALVMELHPIMYVEDQYAEREFYERLGFERVYEGDEFPGFLAIRHGGAVIGLQRASAENRSYVEGLRWQFELGDEDEVDEIVNACIAHNLQHEILSEHGGDRFAHRMVRVVSPNGVAVWFEGPNQAAQ